MDFVISIYRELLRTLLEKNYAFQTLEKFLSAPMGKAIILRHDVDALPENSLKFAKIQAELGISGSYYFRIVPGSFNEKIITEISKLGHEIGYHYETMDYISTKIKSKPVEVYIDEAYVEYCRNLEIFRKTVPVLTTCMHGSPHSKYDNRLIWKKYNYLALGIKAEPYFDINFEKILYLTDTGRRWNGSKVSFRDKSLGISTKLNGEEEYIEWNVKPKPGSLMKPTPESIEFQNRYRFKSSFDITNAARTGSLPKRIMMTFHPQRWTDKSLPWVKEIVFQNVKNVGKYFIVKMRDY